jgi:hypothetical protein
MASRCGPRRQLSPAQPAPLHSNYRNHLATWLRVGCIVLPPLRYLAGLHRVVPSACLRSRLRGPGAAPPCRPRAARTSTWPTCNGQSWRCRRRGSSGLISVRSLIASLPSTETLVLEVEEPFDSPCRHRRDAEPRHPAAVIQPAAADGVEEAIVAVLQLVHVRARYALFAVIPCQPACAVSLTAVTRHRLGVARHCSYRSPSGRSRGSC